MGRASNRKKIRRQNAKIYPFYKMFSWDLLCFYSIEFLFLTITKKINVSDVLLIDAFYLLIKCLIQIPSITVCDFLGKKKSIIVGNASLSLYILTLMLAPNIPIIMVGKVLCAFAFAIKNLSESNLLYDSVATKGGDGLYSKIDSKGGSMYYILDGISALVAGYLFVINNYLPMIICFICTIIGTCLSFGLSDVYDVKKDKKKNAIETFKEYGKDLKDTCVFIFYSNRMKAFILFRMVFYSIIRVTEVYRSDLLLNVGISQEQFSIIFAMFTFIAAGAVSMREGLEKKFKNRTLAFLSIIYVLATVAIGLIAMRSSTFTIPLILIMLVILKVAHSIWNVLEGKYLKNFTNEKVRSKITFTYEFIGCLATAIASALAGKLVQFVSIEYAFLIVGLVGLIGVILVLDYMRPRFGLQPKEYSKKDIEFSK